MEGKEHLNGKEIRVKYTETEQFKGKAKAF